jgi:hypothetical protein
MDIICYCRICVKEINKKYENITQKIIDDLSIYDNSPIIRVIENFSDSGKWGVTENGNVVFIHEGHQQYVKIQHFSNNSENNKSYVFNFNKYNNIECNSKKKNNNYNKNNQKKCCNKYKLRKTNDKIQLKHSNKKLETQKRRKNKFLNKKIKKTFNFHKFFDDKYFDCNPIDEYDEYYFPIKASKQYDLYDYYYYDYHYDYYYDYNNNNDLF